jgi:hypothetical protein
LGDIFRKDSFWRKYDEEALQERSSQETFMVTSAWGAMVAKKNAGNITINHEVERNDWPRNDSMSVCRVINLFG